MNEKTKGIVIFLLLNCAFLGALLPFLASPSSSSSSNLRSSVDPNTVHYDHHEEGQVGRHNRRLCTPQDIKNKRKGCGGGNGAQTLQVPSTTTVSEPSDTNAASQPSQPVVAVQSSGSHNTGNRHQNNLKNLARSIPIGRGPVNNHANQQRNHNKNNAARSIPTNRKRVPNERRPPGASHNYRNNNRNQNNRNGGRSAPARPATGSYNKFSNRNKRNIKYGQGTQLSPAQLQKDAKDREKYAKKQLLDKMRLKKLNEKFNAVDQEKADAQNKIKRLTAERNDLKRLYNQVGTADDPARVQRYNPITGLREQDPIRLGNNYMSGTDQVRKIKIKMKTDELKKQIADEEERVKTAEVAADIIMATAKIPNDIHKYDDQIGNMVKGAVNQNLDKLIAAKIQGVDYKIQIDKVKLKPPLTKEQMERMKATEKLFGDPNKIMRQNNGGGGFVNENTPDLDDIEENPLYQTIGGLGDKVVVPESWEANNKGLTRSITGSYP